MYSMPHVDKYPFDAQEGRYPFDASTSAVSPNACLLCQVVLDLLEQQSQPLCCAWITDSGLKLIPHTRTYLGRSSIDAQSFT